MAGAKLVVTIKQACMKTDKATKRKIFRDVLISLLLYALPVLLMLLTFTITGQRPWKEQRAAVSKLK